MRKHLFWSVCLFLLLLLQPAAAFGLSVGVDGQKVEFDAQPEVKNNAIFVPIRPIAEQMHASVSYTGREVVIADFDASGAAIVLHIGSAEAVLQKDGETLQTYTLSSAPYVKGGRTFLPLRFVSEQMGCSVQYTPGLVRIVLPGQEVDGQAVFAVRLGKDGGAVNIDEKETVNALVSLIYDGKLAEAAAPADFAVWDAFGATYELQNRQGGAIATWQFLVPAGAAEQFPAYSAMYLYDALNDRYYAYDPAVFAQKFDENGGILELSLTAYLGGRGSIY